MSDRSSVPHDDGKLPVMECDGQKQTAACENTGCDGQKQTAACENTGCDQTKQDPSGDSQGKKRRRRRNRNKKGKTTEVDDKSREEVGEGSNGSKEGNAQIFNEPDYDKPKSNKDTCDIQVDEVITENIQIGVTNSIETSKELTIKVPEGNLTNNCDIEIDVKSEATLHKINDNSQTLAIIQNIKEKSPILAGSVEEKFIKCGGKEKDVTFVKGTKCSQNATTVKIPSQKKKKKGDLKLVPIDQNFNKSDYGKPKSNKDTCDTQVDEVITENIQIGVTPSIETSKELTIKVPEGNFTKNCDIEIDVKSKVTIHKINDDSQTLATIQNTKEKSPILAGSVEEKIIKCGGNEKDVTSVKGTKSNQNTTTIPSHSKKKKKDYLKLIPISQSPTISKHEKASVHVLEEICLGSKKQISDENTAINVTGIRENKLNSLVNNQNQAQSAHTVRSKEDTDNIFVESRNGCSNQVCFDTGKAPEFIHSVAQLNRAKENKSIMNSIINSPKEHNSKDLLHIPSVSNVDALNSRTSREGGLKKAPNKDHTVDPSKERMSPEILKMTTTESKSIAPVIPNENVLPEIPKMTTIESKSIAPVIPNENVLPEILKMTTTEFKLIAPVIPNENVPPEIPIILDPESDSSDSEYVIPDYVFLEYREQLRPDIAEKLVKMMKKILFRTLERRKQLRPEFDEKLSKMKEENLRTLELKCEEE